MAFNLQSCLGELSDLPGTSGDEGRVADYLQKVFEKNGFSCKRDVIGNLIAKKPSKTKGAPCVVVVAHMDEIGLGVKSISKDGFIRFAKIGGIFDGLIANTRVKIHGDKEDVFGVIGFKPPHLMKEEERKKLAEYDSLYIDIGASSKEEVEKLGIKPGCLVSFESSFKVLRKDLVVGKAFDNRAGCAALCFLAQEAGRGGFDFDLVLIGSVREETGLWGSGTSVFGLDPAPDLAIALDTHMACGTPDVSEDVCTAKMGGGPVVSIVEASGRGFIAPKKLVNWIGEVAKKAKIPVQYALIEGGATDASRMQYLKSGLLAASIGVPARYIHSHNEVLSVKDLESVGELALEMAKAFKNYK